MSKDQIIAEQNAEIEALKHEKAQLLKLIFGSRSEKHKSTPVDVNQLNMFADIEQEEEQPEESTTTSVKGYQKKVNKHPGRQPIPDHLPVEKIYLEPEMDVTGMVKIGEHITETIDYKPASLIRRQYIRSKYAMPDGSKVVIAPMPERPLPKAMAESGLLTYLFVSKFVDHLPFYRLIQLLNRDFKVDLPSSTVNDWFSGTCTLLNALFNKLKEAVLSAHYLQGDESPIKVMDSIKIGKTHQGYMWVYNNPLINLILFDYRKGRGMHGPKEILADFRGVLQCDGYSVYDKIAKKLDFILAGCLVHARRKFVDAKDTDAKRAEVALNIYAKIYKHEKIAKESEDRKAYRQEHIVPLMQQLRAWVDEESIKVLPKSPIGKAMRYTINQWDKLMNIFADGQIELDNNLIENKIRPLALGRKNYLFAGSHKGAERIAMMYSFFASCKANQVNPTDWLKATLEQLPTTSIQDLDKLLPHNFKM